ncbi:hypothetical protein M8A51_18315 [Schlegelella sp. S2-27]|uniref:Uncharacterized protein n=1 Tax=Caldimonas mangrovi TaxID=2944811 RepID=A0ABT0YRW3_9BURK|nr:hypothetical protein [Caldimonas mangrovi]MCM5681485.1 hypothetical protein [Caldimonas mangrovi]
MSVRKVQGSDNALRGQEQGAGQSRQAEGHHGGHTYKVGQQRGQAAARQGARKTPLTRRRPPRKGPSPMQQAGMEEQQQELHDGGMDDQQRPFDPFASMQKDAGGGDAQGGQQRRFGPSGQPPRKMQYKLAVAAGEDGLPRRMIELGLPGAAQLFGPESASRPAPLDLVGALGAVVLAGVKRKCTVRGEPFGLSRLVLNAALAQLVRQGEMAGTLTLSDVKNLLILRQREAWNGWSLPAGEAEAVGDTLALLPLVALNTARPRTRSQRQAAMDRQRLVLRSRGV